MGKTRYELRNKERAKPAKMSEILLEYAQGYFGWAKSPDDKQSMLNLACLCWNIANLPETEREGAILECLSQYARENPDVDDINDLQHDLRKLVERKMLLFSTDKRYVVNAHISTSEGKDVLHVASLRKDG